MATSLRTKRRIFDLSRIILNMLNKGSNFDHEYDISFFPTQYAFVPSKSAIKMHTGIFYVLVLGELDLVQADRGANLPFETTQ